MRRQTTQLWESMRRQPSTRQSIPFPLRLRLEIRRRTPGSAPCMPVAGPQRSRMPGLPWGQVHESTADPEWQLEQPESIGRELPTNRSAGIRSLSAITTSISAVPVTSRPLMVTVCITVTGMAIMDLAVAIPEVLGAALDLAGAGDSEGATATAAGTVSVEVTDFDRSDGD